jgi:uncharacterized protein
MCAIVAPRSGLSIRDETVANRLASFDWTDVYSALDRDGFARLPRLLADVECAELIALYPRNDCFRSRVIMSRHGFGRGEYQYFAYPLPPLVAEIRGAAYSRLVDIANRWHEQMGIASRFPADHGSFLNRCHAAGQTRPTPLLLKYGKDDYNCLHQDLYGEHVFPLQLAMLLSRPEMDFTGGEFVIAEQRPRRQSRVAVVPLLQGDAVIFAVHHRPVRGIRGFHGVNLRHGVSSVRSGNRYVAGVILHDAE